jgi:hypothetical protein
MRMAGKSKGNHNNNGGHGDSNAHITSFDKAAYRRLIGYLTSVDESVNKDPIALAPTADMKLDATLGQRVKAGSKKWTPASSFITQAGTFGNSAHQRYTVVETDTRTFSTALKRAEDVFEHTDDLTKYEASKFSNAYPDVSGGGAGGGGATWGGTGAGGGGATGGGTGGGGGATGGGTGGSGGGK